MYVNIIENVTRCIRLTTEENQLFTDMLKIQHIPAKTKILQEGEVCQFEAYVQKGCLRTYYINSNGFEVTVSFSVEDCWVSDIASFQYQQPSNLYIETLEDTQMYVLTPTSKEELLEKIPKFERVFRMLVQRSLSLVQNRLINTISMKATQRYLEFINLHPTIPQRVPQYYIASYLGVSPEFVSTIKKRLASK